MTDTASRPDQRGFSVREIPFEYEDPHVNDHRERVLEELRLLEAMAAEHYGDEAGHKRKRLSRIDYSNPATTRLIGQLPTVQHWLSQIPTAAALHPSTTRMPPNTRPVLPWITTFGSGSETLRTLTAFAPARRRCERF